MKYKFDTQANNVIKTAHPHGNMLLQIGKKCHKYKKKKGKLHLSWYDMLPDQWPSIAISTNAWSNGAIRKERLQCCVIKLSQTLPD